MKRVPKPILWAAILAVVGLVLTLAVQLWFSPATLALFFMVAIPCSAAAIAIFGIAVYRDAIRPRMNGSSAPSVKP
ncbi:MAG TPA: hypothetical protein VI643_06360 [Planctomycetota bacterium]|nr:hypothetical protein [Planctomycetota bacterium]